MYLVGDDGSPAARAAEALARRIAPAGTEVVTTSEDPHDARAELIAVGAGRAGRLLRDLRCPVLAVPANARLELRTVGAGVDGKPRSRPALNTAIELAGRLGAHLLVLGVYRPPPPSPSRLTGDQTRDEFEYMLGKVSFDTHGGAGHRLLTGRPGPALAAASGDLDLLVVGSGGHGALRNLVGGSVAIHLIEHASCPVLVVPHPRP